MRIGGRLRERHRVTRDAGDLPLIELFREAGDGGRSSWREHDAITGVPAGGVGDGKRRVARPRSFRQLRPGLLELAGASEDTVVHDPQTHVGVHYGKRCVLRRAALAIVEVARRAVERARRTDVVRIPHALEHDLREDAVADAIGRCAVIERSFDDQIAVHRQRRRLRTRGAQLAAGRDGQRAYLSITVEKHILADGYIAGCSGRGPAPGSSITP